jgi:RNA polymerase sigma factor (sigma-70 family)
MKMDQDPFPTQELLAGLRAGGARQERWLHKIYDRHYGLVDFALKKHKVSPDQARDAYADAIIELRKKVLDGTFRGESGYFTYLYKIFLNKIFNTLQKNQTKIGDWVYDLPLHLRDRQRDIQTVLEEEEQFAALMQWFEKLGPQCQNILMDSVYWGYKAEEIAARHQFKDAASARSRKFYCLKKLKALLAQRKKPQTDKRS